MCSTRSRSNVLAFTSRVPLQTRSRHFSAWHISSSTISLLFINPDKFRARCSLDRAVLFDPILLIVSSPVNTCVFKITLVKDWPRFWQASWRGIIYFLSLVPNCCHNSLRSLLLKYGRWLRNKVYATVSFNTTITLSHYLSFTAHPTCMINHSSVFSNHESKSTCTFSAWTSVKISAG